MPPGAGDNEERPIGAVLAGQITSDMDASGPSCKRSRSPSPVQRFLRSSKTFSRQNSLPSNITLNSCAAAAPPNADELSHPSNSGTKASLLLREVNGARVFTNPRKTSQALHQSSLSKYILEGESRSLGDESALIIAIWEHNITKVPELQKQSPFQLGEWKVTYRRTDRDDINYKYGKVGPLASDTNLEEVVDNLKCFDGGEVVEISWIPDRYLPRNTRGK